MGLKIEAKKAIAEVGGVASGGSIGGYIGAGAGIAIGGTAVAATLPFSVGGEIICAGIAYVVAYNVCDDDDEE